MFVFSIHYKAKSMQMGALPILGLGLFFLVWARPLGFNEDKS